jgi:hypothetical protein
VVIFFILVYLLLEYLGAVLYLQLITDKVSLFGRSLIS